MNPRKAATGIIFGADAFEHLHMQPYQSPRHLNTAARLTRAALSIRGIRERKPGCTCVTAAAVNVWSRAGPAPKLLPRLHKSCSTDRQQTVRCSLTTDTGRADGLQACHPRRCQMQSTGLGLGQHGHTSHRGRQLQEKRRLRARKGMPGRRHACQRAVQGEPTPAAPRLVGCTRSGTRRPSSGTSASETPSERGHA